MIVISARRSLTCQIILLLLSSCCIVSRGSNILGVFPFNFKSHFTIYDSLMVELARRGHNVTVISHFPRDKPPSGYRSIDVSSCDRMSMAIYDMDTAYNSHEPFYQSDILFSLSELDRTMLVCPPIKEVLASANETFDVVIAELFCSTTMMAFAEKFNASSRVWFCPVSLLPWGADMIGNPYNPAYVSYQYSPTVLPATDSSFYQRFQNTMIYLYAEFKFYSTMKQQETMKREHLGFVRPSLEDIAKDTSLILTFSHFSVGEPMPLLPNVVEVGGLQIKEASPLPQDIEKFLKESEHGVIYFSLGSLLKVETMPAAKLGAFMKAFSELPQRVLWKWGSDTMPEKNDKILMKKWMPQRDILAHPNVKLFIGHGGALGVNEAVYEGVPILGIPMYADQTLNLKALERQGAAEILEYTDIDDETVSNKLQMMLNDKRYAENMKRVSHIFKDRPMSALDTAVYWVEYVIRHKGAPELRSAAADLPLYQYLLLDVIAVISLFVLVIVFLIIFAFSRLFRLIICSFNDKPREYDGKKSK